MGVPGPDNVDYQWSDLFGKLHLFLHRCGSCQRAGALCWEVSQMWAERSEPSQCKTLNYVVMDWCQLCCNARFWPYWNELVRCLLHERGNWDLLIQMCWMVACTWGVRRKCKHRPSQLLEEGGPVCLLVMTGPWFGPRAWKPISLVYLDQMCGAAPKDLPWEHKKEAPTP